MAPFGKEPGPAPEIIRTGINSELRLLSDFDAQSAYERDVPIANVPAELVCGWFDDSYHPASEPFIAAFSSDELAVLAEFNDFYEARLRTIPTDSGVARLQATPQWTEIRDKAAATLEALDG